MRKKTKIIITSIVILSVLILITFLLIIFRIKTSNDINKTLHNDYPSKSIWFHAWEWEDINIRLNNYKDVFFIPITNKWLTDITFELVWYDWEWNKVFFHDNWYNWHEIDEREKIEKTCNSKGCNPSNISLSDYYSWNIEIYTNNSIFWLNEYRKPYSKNFIIKPNKETFIVNLKNIKYDVSYKLKMLNKNIYWSTSIATYPKWEIIWIYIVFSHWFNDANINVKFSVKDDI